MDNPNDWGGTSELQGRGADFMLPDKVRTFLRNFYEALINNRVLDVRRAYYQQWSELTQAYFKQSEWPSADAVAQICEGNEVFLLVYEELYYRHIFVHGSPALQHRFYSWNNYCLLFDMFLDGALTSELQLPMEWLNDMVDEFLYQFQDFCQYRTKLKNKSQEDLELLQTNPLVWKVHTVLGYLTSFVERSNIAALLSAQRGGSNPTTRMPVLEALGYFSLIGLCRLQCLLSDYRMAVRVLEPIDVDDKRALFTGVTACHITLFYYLGFSYLMMRRYADAINVFSTILLAHRTSKDRTASFADDQIMNKYDKILALTAMAVSLGPGHRVDEQVKQLLNEKYSDKIAQMNRREEAVFEDLFNYACPKFITPAAPDFTDLTNRHQDAYTLQLRLFLREVREQALLPTLRSYLKLYTSIPLKKLAGFCQMEETEFRAALMAMKHKAHQLTHAHDGSAPLSGERTSVSDVHFYIVGDMVHIDEAKRREQHGAYFMEHSMRFQQTMDTLRSW